MLCSFAGKETGWHSTTISVSTRSRNEDIPYAFFTELPQQGRIPRSVVNSACPTHRCFCSPGTSHRPLRPPRPHLTLSLEAFYHHLPLSFVAPEIPEDLFLIRHLLEVSYPSIPLPQLIEYLRILRIGVLRYELSILIDPNVNLTALIEV